VSESHAKTEILGNTQSFVGLQLVENPRLMLNCGMFGSELRMQLIFDQGNNLFESATCCVQMAS
jgi:hypothetical protein